MTLNGFAFGSFSRRDFALGQNGQTYQTASSLVSFVNKRRQGIDDVLSGLLST